MKKIISITLALCFLTTLFCMTAIGVSAAGTTVIRVSGQPRWGGSLVTLGNYDDFEEGWDAAMEYADDEDFMDEYAYDRIVVDLLADWNADEDGDFGRSRLLGFQYSTIYVPDDARVTINLNGKTINRGLTEWRYNGEVICIDDDADVIINNGTITGGFSGNGAGGIHVEDDVNLTLNNVNLVGNAVEDDRGSAIALLGGSKLTMNGGKIANNRLTASAFDLAAQTKGTVYLKGADATFNNVVFSDNKCEANQIEGAVIYVFSSGNVTFNECTIEKHGSDAGFSKNGIYYAASLINMNCSKSKLTMDKCTVRNNFGDSFVNSCVDMTVSNSTFTENDFVWGIFYYEMMDTRTFDISNSTFTYNRARINYIGYADYIKTVFTNCTFNDNGIGDDYAIEGSSSMEIKFTDCDMGNSTYKNKGNLKFVDTSAKNGAASIFGEGSLTMIVAILALITSIVSIFVTGLSNKKKAVPVTAGNVAKTEAETEAEAEDEAE